VQSLIMPPFDILERHVRIAILTIRPKGDNGHDCVFTPDNRAGAQGAHQTGASAPARQRRDRRPA